MFMHAMLAVFAQANDGLSLHKIVASLPRDPASLFTLLLLGGVFGWVLWTGTRPGGRGGRPA